ncbi:MAG: sugar phosphate isomerase/epimerase [Spirochaetales bacterium]|nr:sugar phosphate isomerase/epimerase [Spirochaetales bacterium]MCF7939049.1 sugar phosphate isomerase/epimerase [Spirochaetales bacterium]
MKIGVFSFVFQDLLSYEDALDWIVDAGAQAVEVASGGWPAGFGTRYCNPAELLQSETKITEWKKKADDRGLEISALSCHANLLHPDKAASAEYRKDFRDTVRLAGKLGVRRVVTFSGCPGDSDEAKYPNWITCPWPTDFSTLLEWQWNEKIIPFWQEEVKFCADQGVDMVAIEPHPGFSVYNPETLLKLREAAGPVIGANLDPSHLFWQGIDPIAAVRAVGDAIYYVHAKDTIVDHLNTQVNGVLDTKPYSDEANRSWLFRTVGYGHDLKFWKDYISNLRLAGYDYVLSLEHEDSLISLKEGLVKGVNTLKEAVLTEPKIQPWFD